jgi:hypothetical protein
VHLVDVGGKLVAQSDRQPGGVFYPTTLWRPGERLRDDHLLTVPAGAPAGVYRLLAGMYALGEDGSLQPLGEPVAIGQVGVKTEVETEPGEMDQRVEANFAGQIELLGYDAALQGGALAVTLHWRALQPPDADYTVFVHLVDADGLTVAQHDSQPLGGAYATSVWDAGEVVADKHTLVGAADLPAAKYLLQVGFYLLETGERLAVEGGEDSVELGPVEVGN